MINKKYIFDEKNFEYRTLNDFIDNLIMQINKNLEDIKKKLKEIEDKIKKIEAQL